jgi:predicted ribosome quality control (RQC) complex YloA/Tae2 family protein
LEFFAAGNLIVTDDKHNILALFRVVKEGPENLQINLGAVYRLDIFQTEQDRTLERLKSGLQSALEKKDAPTKGKKQALNLRRAVVHVFREWPAVLVDYGLHLGGFDTSLSIETVLNDQNLLESLMECVKLSASTQDEMLKTPSVKSTIIAKSALDDGRLLYDDYQPFKPKQYESDPNITCLEFDSFNKTVDEFYSSIEGQKLDSKLQEREATAKKKLAETKRQHQDRLGSLKQTQTLNVQKAEAIEANVERVQEAINAVNGLLAQSMDWEDIGNLITIEQKRGNPVAQLIKLPLNLQKKTVTLLLSGPTVENDDNIKDTSDTDESDTDSDDEARNVSKKPSISSNRLAIEIDLDLTPWANASQYYDEKKTAQEKEKRTAQVSEKVLKSAERKVAADLKKGLSKEKDILRPIRRTFWFEKFYYFISSEGYLVLAAKDVQQADLLYSRYFKRGDIFVHAEQNGASVVIIKNSLKTPDAPIPPATLSQAGTFSICSSAAWDSKAIMPAWWVKSEQVTKITPQGDFLTPGNFHITGEKYFLPPIQLIVGVAIAFRISEDSKANHTKHRIQEVSTSPDESQVIEELEEAPTALDGITEESKPDADDSDDSEDFPDVAPTAVDSDDEEFPDVNPLQVNDSDDEMEDGISNPLQTSSSQLSSTPSPASLHDSVLDTTDVESVTGSVFSTSSKTSRRHVTAKERRMMKKGLKPSELIQKSSANAESSTPDAVEETEEVSDTETFATTTVTSKQGSSSLPRGKRTKQKKAAAKYANQDEEDRQLAMARLGALTGNSRKEEEAEERRAKEQAELASKQRRREQHLRVQALGRSAEQARQAALSKAAAGGDAAGVDEHDDETVKQDLLALDSIVGRPLPGDTIISGFAVCAPWSALSKYKYKIKAQPGTLKKGKAAREIIGHWQTASKVPRNVDPTSQDSERFWPREAELIQGIKDTEVITVMPVSKVRIMTTGIKDGKAAAANKGKGRVNRGQRRG